MLDNVIYRWDPGKGISVHLENAGYTGTDFQNVGQQTRRGRSAAILIGPNGLTMDPQGRLVVCAMPDRSVVRYEKDGTRTVVADRFEGKRFSGPNDVVAKSNGSIYFTDSVSGLRGAGGSPQRELPFNGFYLVKNGTVTLLDPEAPRPAGGRQHVPERHCAVAGRTPPLRDLRPQDHALRDQRRRHGEQPDGVRRRGRVTTA